MALKRESSYKPVPESHYVTYLVSLSLSLSLSTVPNISIAKSSFSIVVNGLSLISKNLTWYSLCKLGPPITGHRFSYGLEL